MLTAYSEPASKLIDHMRPFAFFDEDLLGETISVLSLQQYLSRGLEATAEEIVNEARRRRDRLVVIDGFRGISAAPGPAGAARQFLYHLGLALAQLGATTLVTTEAEPRNAALFAEATTADVLIAMHYRLLGVRARRAIEVVKVRGADPPLGLHGLAIGTGGAVVYPRLEALATGAAQEDNGEVGSAAIHAPDTRAKAAFGLPQLDALLDGGLTPATPTLLLGSSGTGKTLLSLYFVLAGLRVGEPAVFLGFHEAPRGTRPHPMRTTTPRPCLSTMAIPGPRPTAREAPRHRAKGMPTQRGTTGHGPPQPTTATPVPPVGDSAGCARVSSTADAWRPTCRRTRTARPRPCGPADYGTPAETPSWRPWCGSSPSTTRTRRCWCSRNSRTPCAT